MHYFGRVTQVWYVGAEGDEAKPSVRVVADHDPTIVNWAEWQTDLRGRQPVIDDSVIVWLDRIMPIAY